MRQFPLLLLAVVGFLSSCDLVEDPYGPDTGGTGPVPVEGVRRRVLLEDFTGHRCIYCPEATTIANQQAQIHGDDLVVVALHVTNFYAAPVPPAGDGYYDNEFRTEAGNAYIGQWPASALPMGLVSRKAYNGSELLSRDAWSSAIAELIGQEALMDVWVDDVQHNGTSGEVNATVKVSVAQDLGGAAHSMVVYLVEDSIIGWQSDANSTPSEIPDYVHRHVLRGTMNGTWGQSVLIGTESVGDTLSFSLPPYTLSSDWNAGQISLVAYVYNTATYEVMQVTERHLQ